MNKYLALLAAVIVTSSLGNSRIHAKNYNVGQADQLKSTLFVPHAEIPPKKLLSPSANNNNTVDVITVSATTGTSIFNPLSGTVFRMETLAPVSGTAIRSKALTSTSGTATGSEPLTSISGAAIKAENIVSKVNTEKIQKQTTATQLEKTKKEPSSNKLKKIKVKKQKYKKMEVPKHNNFKSYMGYKSITCKSSKQYKLQQKAKTGKFGIRTVEGRYLIAMGTYYTKNVGDKFDIKLSDGTIIKCMIGDIKSDKHTDARRQKQKYDGSIIEFISDPAKMPSNVKRTGSYTACRKFSGSIKEIRKLK